MEGYKLSGSNPSETGEAVGRQQVPAERQRALDGIPVPAQTPSPTTAEPGSEGATPSAGNGAGASPKPPLGAGNGGLSSFKRSRLAPPATPSTLGRLLTPIRSASGYLIGKVPLVGSFWKSGASYVGVPPGESEPEQPAGVTATQSTSVVAQIANSYAEQPGAVDQRAKRQRRSEVVDVGTPGPGNAHALLRQGPDLASSEISLAPPAHHTPGFRESGGDAAGSHLRAAEYARSPMPYSSEALMPGMEQDTTPYSSVRQLLRQGPPRSAAHRGAPSSPDTYSHMPRSSLHTQMRNTPQVLNFYARRTPAHRVNMQPGNLFTMGIGSVASTPYSRKRGSTRSILAKQTPVHSTPLYSYTGGKQQDTPHLKKSIMARGTDVSHASGSATPVSNGKAQPYLGWTPMRNAAMERQGNKSASPAKRARPENSPPEGRPMVGSGISSLRTLAGQQASFQRRVRQRQEKPLPIAWPHGPSPTANAGTTTKSGDDVDATNANAKQKLTTETARRILMTLNTMADKPAPAMPLPSSGVTPLLGPSRISSRPAVEHPPQPVESLPAPSVLESQQVSELSVPTERAMETEKYSKRKGAEDEATVKALPPATTAVDKLQDTKPSAVFDVPPAAVAPPTVGSAPQPKAVSEGLGALSTMGAAGSDGYFAAPAKFPSAVQAVASQSTVTPSEFNHEQDNQRVSDPPAKLPSFGLAAEKIANTPKPIDPAVFRFSTGDGHVAVQSIKAITSGRHPAGVEPSFSFGSGAEAGIGSSPSAPTAGLVTPQDVATRTVAEAAAVPLPPGESDDDEDDDTEDKNTPNRQTAASPSPSVKSAGFGVRDFSPSAAAPAKKQPASASGWGTDFIQANASVMSSATAAIERDIKKTKGGSAAAPAESNGWGSAFLQANAKSSAAATAAVQEDIAKQNGGSSGPTARFGIFSSTANLNPITAPTDTAKPAAASPPQPAASGWGADFLKANACSSAAAATAIEDSIAKEKGSDPGPPAVSSGWGNAFLLANAASNASAAAAIEQDISKQSGFEPKPTIASSASGSILKGTSSPKAMDAVTPPSTALAPSTSPAVTFSFGTQSAVPAAPKPTFSFGASAAAVSDPLSFAHPANEAGSSAPAAGGVFGAQLAPPSTAAAFTAVVAASSPAVMEMSSAAPLLAPASFAANPAPTFGASTTAGSGFASAQPSAMPFGAPSSAPGGAQSIGMTTPSAPAISFGAPAASGPTFSFGGQPQTQQPPAPGGFTFGGSSAPAPTFSFGVSAAPAPTFSFGGSAAPATQAAPTFSSPAPTISAPFGAAPDPSTPQFPFGGAPAASAAAFDGGPPAGQAAPSMQFGGAGAAPSFGAAAGGQFSFGAGMEAQPVASGFGNPQSGAPAAGGFSFGSDGGKTGAEGSGLPQRRIVRARRNRGKK